ncbi:MAG: glycosyltransferase family A protein [Caldilineaceae bacterium]
MSDTRIDKHDLRIENEAPENSRLLACAAFSSGCVSPNKVGASIDTVRTASHEQPKVSVVIPAHRQAEYLGAAIESVLKQSYHNLELIVVNDASPDQTNAVVARYDDPRIVLIEHSENRGLPAARNSGMRVATGQIIALLDADDLFHEDKVQAHVEFLQANPQIGVSYNARFEIDPEGQILALWRPATTASFAEMVLGFPFAPSDMVLRREWAFAVDLFDESYKAMSEDLDINCRLALAGCQFGGIDRPLNYRRYYPNRVIRNVPDRLAGAERALNTLFENPACPPAITALREAAFANVYLVWSYEAFMAELTDLAQRCLAQAVSHNPTLVAVEGAQLHEFLVDRSIQDGGDHAAAIRQVIDQLPSHMQWFAAQTQSMIATADLRTGIREVLWGRPEQGQLLLKRAALTNAVVDKALLRLLVDQLLNYRLMLGDATAQLALQRLATQLRVVATRHELRWMVGCYWLNRGLQSVRQHDYARARASIFQAFQADPTNMRNRGAWSTLLKTLKPVLSVR